MNAAIVSTGSFLPPKVIPNEALSQFPAASLALIEQKTGVKTRRHADADQCTSDLAIEAARQCLTRIQFDSQNLDAIILATSSPDRIQPATATRVQDALGALRAFAFDLNAVCSGGVYALSVANALIKSGACRSVLVLAAEIYSRFLNPKDFSTYPYFGDGAGAVLLSADSNRPGIIHCLLRSDGAGGDVIQIPAGGTMLPFSQVSRSSDLYFKMRGKEVFEFAVTKGTEVCEELLSLCGIRRNTVRWVIPHQANINIVKTLSDRLQIPFDRFVVNLDKYGNTAAASVFIALDELVASGGTREGELALLVAFGGGLSWGAVLVRL